MYARDATLDGRYIVAVLSTHIFCLPSCPARKPKAENVRFFATPAAARRAGFRPCLRCRPEDFHAGRDRTLERLAAAVRRVRAAPGDFDAVEAIAGAAGCGITRLNALVRAHYHATPAALLARARVEDAARRLRAGDAVADAGFAAGFRGATAFYENFGRRQGMAPGEYRRLVTRPPRRGPGEFTLALPRAFDSGPVRELLSRDREHTSERVDRCRTAGGEATRLLKAFAIPGAAAGHGVLELTFAGGGAAARVHVADGARPGSAMMAEAHRVAARLLGLAGEPTGLRARGNGPLDTLIAARPGLRVPLMASVFEALVWAILGQQVNLAFAASLRATLIRLTAGGADTHTLLPHPSPAAVAALSPGDLHARRFSRNKAAWLVAVAEAVARGELDLGALAEGPAGTARSALLARKGIGEWTAEYVMLRGMGFQDCLPAGDAGLSRALAGALGLAHRPDASQVRGELDSYRPWRSVVCQHLWASLTAPADETPAGDARLARGTTAPGTDGPACGAAPCPTIDVNTNGPTDGGTAR
jgi:AraC family transcriptional regulator of adaptative response / DNA-3-methyladenine glycosylase II